jgi:hypothetical protein
VTQVVDITPPEGVEMDNLMYYPIKIWVMSQNSLLIHLLELRARELWMNRYMDEIIGARGVEEEIYKSVEEEFEEKKANKKEEEEKESFWGKIKPKYYTKYPDDKNLTEVEKINKSEFKPNRFMSFIRFFVKPGPYEPIIKERLSKMYFRASGFYFKQMVDVLEKAMGIE